MSEDPICRAHRHEAAGEIDQALAAYREVEPASPPFAESRIRVVGIMLMRGRLDEAAAEARAFAAAKPQLPEPHATLGQILRLGFRHDDAIASFRKAAELAPENAGYRMFLNDAVRAKYWSPDADLYGALKIHAGAGQAGWSAKIHLFHLQFVGLLNPELQQWLTAGEGDAVVPEGVRRSLDARFQERFSQELGEVLSMWKDLRGGKSGRVVLSSGATREGAVEDADGTILAALETIRGEEYAIVPFGEIAAVEFGPPAPYVRSRLTLRSGESRDVEVPALYFFTEGCRRQEVREGRRTVWRGFGDGFSVGLGLRSFRVDSELVSLGQVRRIEF
ncbi:MAG: hypothetical protein HYY16_15405 [Planctomycetes bacterium]|nr:hypothetical protein [Planctomycetota bacterium]